MADRPGYLQAACGAGCCRNTWRHAITFSRQTTRWCSHYHLNISQPTQPQDTFTARASCLDSCTGNRRAGFCLLCTFLGTDICDRVCRVVHSGLRLHYPLIQCLLGGCIIQFYRAFSKSWRMCRVRWLGGEIKPTTCCHHRSEHVLTSLLRT